MLQRLDDEESDGGAMSLSPWTVHPALRVILKMDSFPTEKRAGWTSPILELALFHRIIFQVCFS